MKTKHKKYWPIILAAIVAVFASVPAYSRSGSGGTTGGGDYAISAEGLLPKSLHIRGYYPWVYNDFDLGTRAYWGVIAGPTYAERLSIEIAFDRSKISDGDLNVASDAYGVYPRGKIYKRYGDPGRVLQKLRQASQDAPIFIEIEWDGQSITLAQLDAKLELLRQVVLNQFDPSDMKSFIPVRVTSQFLSALTYPNLFSDVSSVIVQHVQAQAGEINALASRSTDGHGGCDQEVYRQLVAKLRSWVDGSPQYFEQVKALTNYPGKLDGLDSAAVVVSKVRSATMQNILDSVLPFCDVTRAEAMHTQVQLDTAPELNNVLKVGQ